MKKVLSLILVFSMVLHCAGRLGVIQYLYEQRNQIALALGIIDEIPIPVCSHDYYSSDGLVVQADDDQQPPVRIAQSHEINLFAGNTTFTWAIKSPFVERQTGFPADDAPCYSTHLSRIFTPPRA